MNGTNRLDDGMLDSSVSTMCPVILWNIIFKTPPISGQCMFAEHLMPRGSAQRVHTTAYDKREADVRADGGVLQSWPHAFFFTVLPLCSADVETPNPPRPLSPHPQDKHFNLLWCSLILKVLLRKRAGIFLVEKYLKVRYVKERSNLSGLPCTLWA